MPARTCQLQIRLTPDEKAALKRRASAAGMTVSRYVLEHALPKTGREVGRMVADLSASPGAAHALRPLADLIEAIPGADFHEALADSALDDLEPVSRNHVAALVEQAAHGKGVDPPEWVDRVTPLDRPHFWWALPSLRPHQVRVTPVPFKRRGIFLDPASSRSVTLENEPADHAAKSTSEATRRLVVLNTVLNRLELRLEFYSMGGAVLSQAFTASPSTAHVKGLFQRESLAREAVTAAAEGEGWEPGWLESAVQECLAGDARGVRYLELSNVAVFAPRPDYVLALKIGALRAGSDPVAIDDLRYALRALNVTSVDGALEVAERYFSKRQIPGDARATLKALLRS